MGRDRQLAAEDLTRLFDVLWSICDRLECTPRQAIDLLFELADRARPRARRDFRLPDLMDRVRRVRMKRNELVGAELFRDPAWDMLLELYCAHADEREVSISGLCYASGVPLSTALRYVARLEDHGMIEREGDRTDLRRCWLRATPQALRGIEDTARLLADQLTGIGVLPEAEARLASQPA